jgi:hypothetical protein
VRDTERNRTSWWSLFGFALVVAIVASALLWAPGIDHGLATSKGVHTAAFSRHEWFDLGVTVAFAAIAAGVLVRLILRRGSRAAA